MAGPRDTRDEKIKKEEKRRDVGRSNMEETPKPERALPVGAIQPGLAVPPGKAAYEERREPERV